jgi:putative ABC transport system permease protein
MYINTLDDEMFNQLCTENDIDYNDYYGDTIKLLLLNNISHKTTGADVFNDKILDNEFDYSDTKLTISDFVKYDENSIACNINPSGTLSFYVPESVWRNIFEKDMSDDDIMVLIGVETTQHENVTQELYNLLEENGDSDRYVQDYVDSLQAMSTLAFVLEVFVYGFIVLISLITVANIINTITTGIAMRKKEFAMLKSVGTTPKGFNKMIALESAFYGIKAVIFAIPISMIISFGMNKALADDIIPFEINWLLYLIVIAVVFVVIGSTMIYSVNKLRDDNIVETLKEEIN